MIVLLGRHGAEGFRPGSSRAADRTNQQDTVAGNEFNLTRQTGSFQDRLGDADPLGVADRDNLGFQSVGPESGFVRRLFVKVITSYLHA